MTQITLLHLPEKKIYAKYTGIFNLSDLAHIHMLVRVHYGDACYQISEEYVMIC